MCPTRYVIALLPAVGLDIQMGHCNASLGLPDASLTRWGSSASKCCHAQAWFDQAELDTRTYSC